MHKENTKTQIEKFLLNGVDDQNRLKLHVGRGDVCLRGILWGRGWLKMWNLWSREKRLLWRTRGEACVWRPAGWGRGRGPRGPSLACSAWRRTWARAEDTVAGRLSRKSSVHTCTCWPLAPSKTSAAALKQPQNSSNTSLWTPIVYKNHIETKPWLKQLLEMQKTEKECCRKIFGKEFFARKR